MVGEHASHRETRQIDAVAVNLILLYHLINECQHKIYVAIARYVPCLIDAVWKNDDKLGRVSYGSHDHLNIPHIGCILVHAVT